MSKKTTCDNHRRHRGGLAKAVLATLLGMLGLPIIAVVLYLIVGRQELPAQDGKDPPRVERDAASSDNFLPPAQYPAAPPRPDAPQERRTERRVILKPVTEKGPDGRVTTKYVPTTVEGNVPSDIRPAVQPDQPRPAERRAMELARQLRQTPDAEEREHLRDELRDQLSRAFDERREQQLAEIEKLERQLDSLRELDAVRQERKDEIVERRMRQLLGEPDVLDWAPHTPRDSAGPSPRPPGATWTPPIPGRGPKRAEAPPADGAPPTRERSQAESIPPGPPRFSRADHDSGEETGGFDAPPSDSVPPRTVRRADNLELELQDREADRSESRRGTLQGLPERIIDLLGEVKVIEQEMTSRFASSPAKASLQTKLAAARAKLQIVELQWQSHGEQLAAEIKQLEARHSHAQARLKRLEPLYKQGAVAVTEVLDAEADVAQAESELDSAKGRLEAWERTQQILQKQRKAIESKDRATSAERQPDGTKNEAKDREVDGSGDADGEAGPEGDSVIDQTDG